MCYGLSFACGYGGGGGGGTSHQEMENYKNIPLSLSASSPYVYWMSSSLDTAFPVL